MPHFWACLLFSLDLAPDFWTPGADGTRAGLQQKRLTAAFLLRQLLQPVSRTKQTRLYYFCFTRGYTREAVCFLGAFFPGCNTQLPSLFLHVKGQAPHPTVTEVRKSLYKLWTFFLQGAEWRQVTPPELRIKLTTPDLKNEPARHLLGLLLQDGGSWSPKVFLGSPSTRQLWCAQLCTGQGPTAWTGRWISWHGSSPTGDLACSSARPHILRWTYIFLHLNMVKLDLSPKVHNVTKSASIVGEK